MSTLSYAYAEWRNACEDAGRVFGWNPIENGWTFQLDGAKRRLGCCHLQKKIISLSRNWIQKLPDTDVRNTIRHEIAHAVAYHLYKSRGHCQRWKRVCIQIGASPNRTYQGEARVDHKWERVCINEECPTTVAGRYHRKPRSARYVCARCRGKLRIRRAR